MCLFGDDTDVPQKLCNLSPVQNPDIEFDVGDILVVEVRGYFLVFVQLLEKYGTLIERYTALIEKVSPCIGCRNRRSE
eukprot:SAG31_NODE_2595_length_5421_cov_2.387636_5_plen_78_part_00